jgi:hypothetical protein
LDVCLAVISWNQALAETIRFFALI